jgi:histidinol-phosphate/aromatic aminotransferase/cobyric acid decarboxylase-like protein
VRRLFDRYRQFSELPPEEVSRELRERRDEERAREVVFVPELDLARTAWHEPPHPEAVNAATFALRRRMNAYPDPGAREVRELAAERHGVSPAQVAVGHGAAELLQEACAELLHDEGELLVAWPGWGPLPELARRVGGRPASVPGEGGIGPLADRVGRDTRAVALSSPNDPTGAAVAREDVRALCERVGERVWVLLDEALADFLEPGEDAAGLVAELPNLLVFRTFAKAHAMAGFRIGYVLGPAEMAVRLTPSFSVNAPAQAAAAWSLELGDAVIARRRAAAVRERERLAAALHGTSLSFPPTAAPFVWLSSDAHSGREIAEHLGLRRIKVAAGEQWGDVRHVRVTLRDAAATDRLVAALRELG